jgi:TldD protein
VEKGYSLWVEKRSINEEDIMKDLAELALDTAKSKGASYADIRICRYRNQYIFGRDKRIETTADTEDVGFGIRVIANGAWGFASGYKLEKDEVQRIATLAVEVAKASSRLLRQPVELAPEPAYQDHWQSPIQKNPFKIPMEKKIDLILKINEEMLKVNGIKVATAFLNFNEMWKYFASTDGSFIEQDLIFTYPNFTAVAVGADDSQTRSIQVPPEQKGYELIESVDWVEQARKTAEEAVQKLKAKQGAAGKKDLVLMPSHLCLTIHESIGHATELDRALGWEADMAGTTFVTPDKLGKLQYGSPLMNIVGDKLIPNALATVGYDDDGVKARRFNIIKEGIFVGYQTTRELARFVNEKESKGCAFADSWSSFPLQRMPNLWLKPGEKPLTLDQLIADTKDGLLFDGMGSFSIDQQRYNFQFGGDAVWEIKNGKVGDMVKNVAYQSKTTDFWGSLDAVCSQEAWENWGVFGCGKGEPGQSARMGHGSAPSRFRQVNIISAGGKL